MIFPSSIGNYKLTPTTLGKGSFSKVVLANHVILNKQVALKVVTLHKIKDPYVSKNLKREAAIMAKLNHPNIVSLHEVVSVGDFHSALRGGVISRFHKRGSRMHLGDPFGSLKDRSTNITPHFGILGLPGPKNGQKRPKSGQKQGKAKFWASDGPKWLDQCGSKVDLVLGRNSNCIS